MGGVGRLSGAEERAEALWIPGVLGVRDAVVEEKVLVLLENCFNLV